jgi:type I restriction enzyme S subunit
MNSQFNQIGAIKDFAIGIYDGPHATPAESDQGSVFLGIKNITPDGRLDLTDIRYISEQDLPKWTRRVTPQKDDIVFSYEATLHRYALIPENFMGCLGRRMALVRPDLSKICPRFLHYYFLSEAWRSVIESNLISGATVDRIPIARFPNFTIKIPVLSQQNKIANILSAYDDLIENNRRRIQLLERSLHLLYKEWFIHLRFPSHEHSKIKDGIPEGWEKKTIDKICSTIGGGTPSTQNPEYWDGDITWITPTDITRNDCLVLLDSQKKITESGLRNSSAKLLPPNTILMTSRASVGFFALIDKEVCTNQGFISIIPHDDLLRMFLLCNLMGRVEEIRSRAGGTTYMEISKSQFRAMEVVIPPTLLLQQFDEAASKILQQVSLLKRQTTKLQQARDLLLPKLMSGAISV